MAALGPRLIADLGIEEALGRGAAYAEAGADLPLIHYANHAVCTAAQAMRETLAAIRQDGGIHKVDQRIASVEDIFDLQRVAAMKAAEKKYLR